MLFWKKLNQNKIYVSIVFIICIFASIIYSFKFIPKEYSVTSTIMLVKNANLQNLGQLELSDGLMAIIEEIIKSDLTIEKIKDKLNLNFEKNELNKKIEVRKSESSNTLNISVKNQDSDVALNVNKEIINVFSGRIKDMYSDCEIYIVDSAHIVDFSRPSNSYIPFIIAIITGTLLNIIYVLVLVKNEEKSKLEIEKDITLKTLTEIPLLKNNKKEIKQELLIYENKNFKILNAFEALRRNIQFLSVNNELAKRVILITSPNKEEGKTFLAANLAISFSEIGKKVILIDADMENGRLDKIFNIPSGLGLSNYLSNLDVNGAEINEFLNKFIKETEIKNLSIIPSGTVPPNSSELLTSNKLPELIKDLKVFYDVVIIDSLPALSSTDSLILARLSASTIIVSDSKKTKKEDLIKTKNDIQNVGGKILGVAFNRVKIRKNRKTSKERKNEFYKFKNKIIDRIKRVIKYKENKQKLLTEGVNNKKEVIKPEVNKNTKKYRRKLSIIERLKQIKFIDSIKNKINNIKTEVNKNKSENFEQENTKIEKDILKDVEIKEEKESIKKVESTEEKEEVKVDIFETFSKAKEKVSSVAQNSKLKFVENAQKIKENSSKVLVNVKNIYQEKVSNIKESAQIKEKEVVFEENIEKEKINTENELNQSVELLDESVENDNTVLVIVDAENAYCRVFSKECFTEKRIRGIDQKDGFPKAHYSSKILRMRKTGLIETYGLTKKQAERIDSLIYVTLSDYDDSIWYEQKKPSNKAENYVMCMAKEYEKVLGEKNKDYIARCKRLRKNELKKAEIDIEYKLENLWKTTKIRISDKIAMKKFANFYEVDNKLRSDKEIMKSNEKKRFYTDIINGADEKLKSSKKTSYSSEKYILDDVYQEDELEREIREEQELIEREQEELRKEQEKLKLEKKAEQEKLKQERKAERERIKQELKDEREKQKQIKREENFRKKEEKNKLKEEQKMQKELEREKQREEAKIEEELLVDNLYPKTKHNKNL